MGVAFACLALLLVVLEAAQAVRPTLQEGAAEAPAEVEVPLPPIAEGASQAWGGEPLLDDPSLGSFAPLVPRGGRANRVTGDVSEPVITPLEPRSVHSSSTGSLSYSTLWIKNQCSRCTGPLLVVVRFQPLLGPTTGSSGGWVNQGPFTLDYDGSRMLVSTLQPNIYYYAECKMGTTLYQWTGESAVSVALSSTSCPKLSFAMVALPATGDYEMTLSCPTPTQGTSSELSAGDIVRSQAMAEEFSYATWSVTNGCGSCNQVNIMARYQPLFGATDTNGNLMWVNSGWFPLAYNAAATTILATQNKNVYWYAYCASNPASYWGGTIAWQTSDSSGCRSTPLRLWTMASTSADEGVLLTCNSPAWVVPPAPVLYGPSALDKTVTSMMEDVNGLVPAAASAFYNRAVAPSCNCLPAKYNAATVEASVKLIIDDLNWTDEKLAAVWAEASRKSTELGTVIDPRLLLAIIRQEGTGSFNTNMRPPAADGGGGTQPDFATDLAMAFNGHVLGKIWAYTHYASAYISAASANRGRSFTVTYFKSSVCGPKATKTVNYQGTGDMFEYVNADNLRLKSTSPTTYTISYGVYACDYNWSSGIRSFFERQTYTGGARDYSVYVSKNPIRWPSNVNSGSPPAQTFALKAAATDWSGRLGGYPTLLRSTSGGCTPCPCSRSRC